MAALSRESKASREEVESLTGRTIKPPRALREMFLQFGAAALVDGVVARPLEDAVALERATPMGEAGALGFDTRAVRLRRRSSGCSREGAGVTRDRQSGQALTGTAIRGVACMSCEPSRFFADLGDVDLQLDRYRPRLLCCGACIPAASQVVDACSSTRAAYSVAAWLSPSKTTAHS
jgi:hypothetical protein